MPPNPFRRMNPGQCEAAVKSTVIAAARHGVALADHTKVGNDYLARFGALAEIDVLIADTGLDTDTADELAAAEPKVVRAL